MVFYLHPEARVVLAHIGAVPAVLVVSLSINIIFKEE
jgi:hypothetical protein